MKPDEKGKVGWRGRFKQGAFAAFNPGAVKEALAKRREKMKHETGEIASKAAEEMVMAAKETEKVGREQSQAAAAAGNARRKKG